jgi:hypothetical protein
MILTMQVGNNSVANAETDITVLGTGVGAGAHANGNVYYSSYEFTIIGDWQGCYYKVSDEPDWIIIPESVFSLERSVNGEEISFAKSQNGQILQSTVFKYDHKLYIDTAPEIILNPIEDYFKAEYTVGFELGIAYVGFSITVTTTQGISTVIPAGVNQFTVGTEGNYIITALSDTGASKTITYESRIDLEAPNFLVYALPGGNNGVWASKASYVIIPTTIPKSGVLFWWSTDNGLTKNNTGADELSQYVVEITEPRPGKIIFGAVSGAGVEYVFTPQDDDLRFILYVDNVVPTLSVKLEGDNSKPTMGKIEVTITTSGNTSGTRVFYAIEKEDFVEYNKSQLTITKPGIYRFYAISGADIRSVDVIKDITYLDITPPVLKVISGNSSGSGIYKSDIKVSSTDLAKVNITCNGDEIESKFDDAKVMEFKKSGFYMIEVFDVAGNRSELIFEISKPNIALIISLSLLTAFGVGAIVWLVLSNMKKAASIRRLVSSSTVSDENNKFLMFKRIRKGGK